MTAIEIEFFRLARTGKYFAVDQRWTDVGPTGYYDSGTSYAHIHQKSTAPLGAVTQKLFQLVSRWTREPEYAYVVEANNKTQVKDWLLSTGHNVEFQSCISKPHTTGENMATFGVGENPYMTARDRKIRAAQRRIEQEQARIEKLESLPAEPEPIDDDNSACIWFQKTFGGNRVYTYCAVLADGRWWTSGPQGGGVGRSWDELVEWIISDNEYPTIYVATAWEPLN